MKKVTINRVELFKLMDIAKLNIMANIFTILTAPTGIGSFVSVTLDDIDKDHPYNITDYESW